MNRKPQKSKDELLELSIIIPVYNERENILRTLAEIKRNILIPYEIIIVYDFDEDTTLDVLRKNIKQSTNLFVVKNNIFRGPSGAIRTGIARARASRILVTMADLCDDLTQVSQMVRLVPKKFSIACPSRYCKGGEQQLKGSLKVWAPRLAGQLLHFLAGIPTLDPTNSYKLYSAELFKHITLTSTESFSVTLEIVVKSHAQGYGIIEIPTVWKDRQHGKTNFKFGRSLVTYFPWFCFAILHR